MMNQKFVLKLKAGGGGREMEKIYTIVPNNALWAMLLGNLSFIVNSLMTDEGTKTFVY